MKFLQWVNYRDSRKIFREILFAKCRSGVSPWLWTWFIIWTAADVYTTISLARAGVGYELNPFINAAAPYTGFDAAVFIAAAFSIALMWALAKTRLRLALLVAKTFMATRLLAPLNNTLLLATGSTLLDVLTAAGLDPHAAAAAMGLAAILPTAVYYASKAAEKEDP